jgi:hypothetical protein
LVHHIEHTKEKIDQGHQHVPPAPLAPEPSVAPEPDTGSEPPGEEPVVSSNDGRPVVTDTGGEIVSAQIAPVIDAAEAAPAAVVELVSSVTPSAHSPAAALASSEKPTAQASSFAGLFSQSTVAVTDAIGAGVQAEAAAPVAIADSALPAAARAIETAVAAPAKYFRFERLSNPMALIGDSLAAFGDESALLGSTLTNTRFTRAWAITAGVLAFDAAALMYFVASRKRRRALAAMNEWSMDLHGQFAP